MALHRLDSTSVLELEAAVKLLEAGAVLNDARVHEVRMLPCRYSRWFVTTTVIIRRLWTGMA